jgi:hypothetical protein
MKKIGNKSALMAAIDSLNDNVRREDEFTMKEFLETAAKSGKPLPQKTASEHLRRLVDDGVLSLRKICLHGKITNVYGKP